MVHAFAVFLFCFPFVVGVDAISFAIHICLMAFCRGKMLCFGEEQVLFTPSSGTLHQQSVYGGWFFFME
jgi:hypothetical protein